ncbi:MAG: dNTP triphosphohydrolase [Opitutaceae bacterium]|nr:dNTP triphosphohydrolase [Opitutaceae bacterium]
MENTFYGDFDTERLPGKLDRVHQDEYRTPFQVDRDRIIHSSAFRRLQSKTQVFLSGEYDFYRTRLTHSIEVAQIGRSICQYLRSSSELLSSGFYIDEDLVEAVCLAHDLGHPPFGHAGEKILHALMKDFGGFEGNAQTLRMLTEVIYQTEKACYGIAPTRACLDGVLKYKVLFGDSNGARNHFLYDSQKACRDFAFQEAVIPSDLCEGMRLNEIKSIECQIMDWADDTAYSLNDIIDGVRAGFLTFEKMDKWAMNEDLSSEETSFLSDLKSAILSDKLEATFSVKIGSFLKGCHLVKTENFLSEKSNRYAYALEINKGIKKESRFYKKLAQQCIFQSPELQQMEYKGGQILKYLWESFSDGMNGDGKMDGFRVLPKAINQRIDASSSENDRCRILCDHLSGMTDGSAIRTYKRLSDPSYGSIVDLE